MMLSWTSLNPSVLVQQMNSFDKYFNFKSFEKFMKQVSADSFWYSLPFPGLSTLKISKFDIFWLSAKIPEGMRNEDLMT